MNNVLVVAVHPDDETLGCGGALLKHKESGDKIHWLILTEVKVSEGYKQEVVDTREQEISAVGELYEFDSISRLGFTTMRLDECSMSKLISEISSVFKNIKPNVIYLPFKNDVHSDHRKAFEAAYSCTKSFRYSFIKKIYMMEVLSETDFSPSVGDGFVPNKFVDISEFMEKKIKIMNVFKSEVGVHPFPRSEKNIRALGVVRGASAGCDYAESFVLLKEID